MSTNSKISNKFDDLIAWIDKNQRMPRKPTPALRKKMLEAGVSVDEIDKEKTFYNFIIEYKYDNVSYDVKMRLDLCPIYMDWYRKLSVSRKNMSYEEKFKELIDWIEENQKMPRVIQTAKKAQLIDAGANAEELTKEISLATFSYDHKFKDQSTEVQNMLSKCKIYMDWNGPSHVKEDNANAKVIELVDWLNAKGRMPRKLTTKRKEELFAKGDGTMEELSKEMILYNFNVKHKYETHSENSKALLDSCDVYTKWRSAK